MTTQSGATRAKPSCAEESATTPLDLHRLSQTLSACGYERDLNLRAHAAQSIFNSLYGISAITRLLIAASDDEALTLNGYMRGGLLAAIQRLSASAHVELEYANK